MVPMYKIDDSKQFKTEGERILTCKFETPVVDLLLKCDVRGIPYNCYLYEHDPKIYKTYNIAMLGMSTSRTIYDIVSIKASKYKFAVSKDGHPCLIILIYVLPQKILTKIYDDCLSLFPGKRDYFEIITQCERNYIRSNVILKYIFDLTNSLEWIVKAYLGDNRQFTYDTKFSLSCLFNDRDICFNKFYYQAIICTYCSIIA